MANDFYQDNDDLRFYVEKWIDWEPLYNLIEAEGRAEGAPKSVPEALARHLRADQGVRAARALRAARNGRHERAGARLLLGVGSVRARRRLGHGASWLSRRHRA